jgi:hypothetical protein
MKFLDEFEMAPIVGQNREAVVQRRSTNQKVEVANRLTSGSQPASLATKHSRGFLIWANQLNAAEKILERFLALPWIAGIENALAELGK